MKEAEDQGLSNLPNITKLEQVTEQAFVWLQTCSLSIHAPARSVWEGNELRPGGWAEGWSWGGDPRATMVERGRAQGVWGQYPVTSQSKVTPTLDRPECLAVGLGVKSHSTPGQRLASHRLALLSFAWERTLSAVREHPGLSHACREALVWGFEVGTSAPRSDALCRALPRSLSSHGMGARPGPAWALTALLVLTGAWLSRSLHPGRVLEAWALHGPAPGCQPGSTGSVVSDQTHNSRC